MVLTFPRDTAVGKPASLEALGGGRGAEEADPVEAEKEEGRSRMRMFNSFVFPWYARLSFRFFFFGEHGYRR